MSVTIEHPDTGSATYRVVCLGDTATITGNDAIDPVAACVTLGEAAVKKRLIEGPPAGQICTEQYGGPDVARIVGTIDDVEFQAEIDRVNGCGIGDWDSLLGGLLPPALGVTG